MIAFKLESLDEVKVIGVFHLIGLALELYKVHMGSWSYPEEASHQAVRRPFVQRLSAPGSSCDCQLYDRCNAEAFKRQSREDELLQAGKGLKGRFKKAVRKNRFKKRIHFDLAFFKMDS